MKLIHLINTFATCITLLGYILFIYPGMLAQIILGPLQIILAIIISVKYFDLVKYENQKHLEKYWTAVVISLILIVISYKNHAAFNNFKIVTVFVIPMLIACYFLYITNLINKNLDKP